MEADKSLRNWRGRQYMIEERYIKIVVDGLTGGRAWVFKPKLGNGALVKDPMNATEFTEMEAFNMRKKVISQLPKDVKVTFDLRRPK
jgi:hypothetical protein